MLPRIFIEYQIVSSKFTSMINQAAILKGLALDTRKKLEENKEMSQLSRNRGPRKVAVSQTIEFEENRDNKAKGLGQSFKPYIMSEGQQMKYMQNKDSDVQKKEDQITKEEQEKLMSQMNQLE